MYGYVLWEVLWHDWYLSACIDMVCFMECIGTYCFGMYCMFWNVLVSTDTLFMQVLIRICLYWYVKKKCCALYEFVGVGQSDGWGLVSYDQLTAVLNFVVFNRPEKNLNSTQIILGFLQIQPLQPIGRVQFWVQVQAPACHRLCWRLFQKTLPNQWPSSWSSAPVQLWQVWHSDWCTQTQAAFTPAAVTGGSYLLAIGKRATPHAILTQFKSQKGLNGMQILGHD